MLFQHLLFISLNLHHTKVHEQHYEYVIIFIKHNDLGNQNNNVEVHCAWGKTFLKSQKIVHIIFVHKSLYLVLL